MGGDSKPRNKQILNYNKNVLVVFVGRVICCKHTLSEVNNTLPITLPFLRIFLVVEPCRPKRLGRGSEQASKSQILVGCLYVHL